MSTTADKRQHTDGEIIAMLERAVDTIDAYVRFTLPAIPIWRRRRRARQAAARRADAEDLLSFFRAQQRGDAA